MSTGWVIGGSPDASVIVWTPGPGIANAMSSLPGLTLASRIA
jgi:hypothetical protein